MKGSRAERPRFEEIVEGTVESYNVEQVLVYPDSITRVGDCYEFTVAWVFSEGIPDFQYDINKKEVTVGGKKAVVNFESTTYNISKNMRNRPVLNLVPEKLDSSGSVSLSTLQRFLDEVTMDAEALYRILVESEKTECSVQDISISAFTSESSIAARARYKSLLKRIGEQSFQNEGVTKDSIKLLVRLNTDHHVELQGVKSRWRFDHVENLKVNQSTYPVEITVRTKEELKNGKLIHVGESQNSTSNRDDLDFLEEIQKIDLDTLLHGDASWPNDTE